MSARVDVEEIETTKSEKLLAFVLAVFLLIGGLWIYFEPLDRGDEAAFDSAGLAPAGSPQDHEALERRRQAERRVRFAERSERAARENLEVRREAYRTAIEAGRESRELERGYRRAEAAFEAAGRRTRQASQALDAVRPPAEAAERRIAAAERRRVDELERREDRRARETFLLRLGYVLATIFAGYWLLNRLRRHRSRYLTVGLAFVGFAAVQALVMATDYTTDYIDAGEVGPLVLSLVGIAMTLAGLVALQRYLAQRLPQRRVRRRECPFCGFPVTDNRHCEGCGRAVIAECTTCTGQRRVGTPRCGICGSA